MLQHPINRQREESVTFGERAAEAMQRRIGSWTFLIGQSIFLCIWIVLNVIAIFQHWDPYPFILLNLMLSFQAAYTGPILLIASNRSQVHDRAVADATYTDTELLKRLIRENTKLTESIHALTEQLHDHLVEDQSQAASLNAAIPASESESST